MPWKRIVGWVREGARLAGPDQDLPPWESPVDPGYGVGSERPDQGPVRPPHVGIKPPGLPVLPIDPDWGLPPAAGHLPTLPGHWLPVDPGYGKPPVFGFLPTDPGFGVEVPVGPGHELPGQTPGHWLPVDPNYGVPACPGTRPPHVWIWIPEVGPDFGLKPSHPIDRPEPK
jgi:hypothetical protein